MAPEDEALKGVSCITDAGTIIRIVISDGIPGRETEKDIVKSADVPSDNIAG